MTAKTRRLRELLAAGELLYMHAIPRDEFVAKIKYACLQRNETDPDFAVIARSDTCRELGLDAYYRIETETVEPDSRLG